jgi:glycosyltransferase involved in cell wall biosynthesis
MENPVALVSSVRARRAAGQRTHAHGPGAPPRGPPSLRMPRIEAAPRFRTGQRLRVSVVIPALNEQDSIEWVLAHIPPWVSEVVLVDGLSIDFTEAVARVVRPDLVVVHQHERGKGAALRAGFAAATGDIVAMIDADGSTDPWELGRFVDALEAGADFVKGSRLVKGGGSADFTMLRRAGNRGFVLLVNLLYGSRFTDLCYGFCAFWRRHLDALDLTANGFEIETQLVLSAVKAKLKIAEVPSLELPRRAGKSNLSAFRDGRRVLNTILQERRSRADQTEALVTRIELVKLEAPTHALAAWRPAGYDRRRGDRRMLDRLTSGYRGPERRLSERRLPEQTATVYVALEQATERARDKADVRALTSWPLTQASTSVEPYIRSDGE